MASYGLGVVGEVGAGTALPQLLAYRKIDPRDRGTGYAGELVALYGSAILTWVAAMGWSFSL